MTTRSGGDRERPAGERALIRLPRVERQAGALAWLPETRPVQFVLVTSRRRGRWVFPKGSVSHGRTAPETAALEALEEAGVVGWAEAEPVGSYHGQKVRPPRTWPIEVEIYPLRVEEVREHWPEENERARRFVTLEEARLLIADPAMLRIAERFAAAR